METKRKKAVLKPRACRLPEALWQYICAIASGDGVKPGRIMREFVIAGAQQHMQQSGRKDIAVEAG